MISKLVPEIADVRIIVPQRFEDERGIFSETYSRQRLAALGIEHEFVQDNHSISRQKGTVRGLHYQVPPFAQAKLVRVIAGAILDVVVDLRWGSPTFGRHMTVELSAANWKQLYVPPGLAHGFCTRAPGTEVLYKVSQYHSPDHERGILWNDPELGIEWPVHPDAAVVSKRDRGWPRLADLAESLRHQR